MKLEISEIFVANIYLEIKISVHTYIHTNFNIYTTSCLNEITNITDSILLLNIIVIDIIDFI